MGKNKGPNGTRPRKDPRFNRRSKAQHLRREKEKLKREAEKKARGFNISTTDEYFAPVVPKEEKLDNIPLEPTVVIKEEPADYFSTPSTSNASATDEFILPHEDSSWVATTVVEPQFTLSVASLGSPSESNATGNEQAQKKLKTCQPKAPVSVPPTNGPATGSEGSGNNFGESSNFGSSRSKDQFDVFGEYIAAKLRNLDRVSCAFTQKAIADIVFEAEMGKYLNQSESAKSEPVQKN